MCSASGRSGAKRACSSGRAPPTRPSPVRAPWRSTSPCGAADAVGGYGREHGGPGTRDGHWRETVFHNELMSGFISEPGNPLSRITAASLADLGYQVDLDAAEPFELPDLLELAEAGKLVEHAAPIDDGIVLPVIPITLPAGSLGPPRATAPWPVRAPVRGDRPEAGVVAAARAPSSWATRRWCPSATSSGPTQPLHPRAGGRRAIPPGSAGARRRARRGAPRGDPGCAARGGRRPLPRRGWQRPLRRGRRASLRRLPDV